MPVPGPDIAQYGLAVFAVAGLVYLVDRWIKQKGDNDLAEVVQNNTKALENLTTLIQVNLTRQEAKIDELLERARR
jgi:NMD protein affecting ribosome stability and mRNA decay